MSDVPSWTLLHAHLHRTLKQRQLLEVGQRILVAVSGGQDSLCLLRLLVDLQPKWNWHLAVAHCDHRWQPDTGNADFVQNLADAWKLPFYLKTAERIDKTEAGAREWRYQALAQMAQQYHLACIVTGHTASDRAETLLYNLVRGSGADGLQALTWKRPLAAGVFLIRPLLGVTRAETAQFCQEMGLEFWHDPSNQDLKYARNRIRRELLPYLCTHFNPQAEQTLAQTAELLQAEVDYLESEANQLLQQSLHQNQLRLNRVLVRQAPLALQRRVIRRFLQSLLPCAPGFEHIEKIIPLLNAPNRSQTDPLPGGAIAIVQGDWIQLI
ncbi:tRNA lysidine(34) synthetase TilS [Leptothermofonsia sp. ETS-13]|uniref:tRNA lysidine(34) synthetase TilS n=1 Tax=Leptothermofonsia sp. ETS-13 TaxID=3035696 RepID=UPI003BA239B4